MKRNEITDFVVENELLQDTVLKRSGIYVITIDNCIVYVGQSKNVYERCCQHIYNTQNAILNQEKKYLLLLSAQLGGHKVDCVGVRYCDIDCLDEMENKYIEKYTPCLNILTPYGQQDISNLKIEDVFARLLWKRDKIAVPTFLGEVQPKEVITA